MSLITLQDVRKTYKSTSGPVNALNGLNLSVKEGTVRALLGPNGSGKTTVVGILTTLLLPTSGTALIDGIDVSAHPNRVREIIGASGQEATTDRLLTARENLRLVGRLYHLGRRVTRQRADELIEMFDLEEAANRPIEGFSGGMRRRADLAASLMSEPKVLFLDEPTTGLDPSARLKLWEIIRDRIRAGTTLLLTTQYLEEADQLADDISVVNSGRVIAEGTADQLKASIGGQQLIITLADHKDSDAALSILERYAVPSRDGSHIKRDSGNRELSMSVTDGADALLGVLSELKKNNIALYDATISHPSLDDVFMQLTNKPKNNLSSNTTDLEGSIQ